MDGTLKEKATALQVVDSENVYEVNDENIELNENFNGREHHEIKHEVVAAYNEVLRKIKVTKRTNVEDREEETQDIVEETVIEKLKSETPEIYVRHIMDLKSAIATSLDEVREKLLPEYEKFHTIRQAIQFSEKELLELYDIKVNFQTLSTLLLSQKEKTAQFEQDIREKRHAIESEIALVKRNWHQEENEYLLKRDSLRKRDQEQYESKRSELEHELAIKRATFEEEFDTREARIAARESEHQKLKQREAMITAREQEYQQLKSRAMRYPDDLRQAVQRAEQTINDQLTRKYEYDVRMMQIELESERKLFQQRISALEEQIEQYKSLKQMFCQSNIAASALPTDETDGSM